MPVSTPVHLLPNEKLPDVNETIEGHPPETREQHPHWPKSFENANGGEGNGLADDLEDSINLDALEFGEPTFDGPNPFHLEQRTAHEAPRNWEDFPPEDSDENWLAEGSITGFEFPTDSASELSNPGGDLSIEPNGPGTTVPQSTVEYGARDSYSFVLLITALCALVLGLAFSTHFAREASITAREAATLSDKLQSLEADLEESDRRTHDLRNENQQILAREAHLRWAAERAELMAIRETIQQRVLWGWESYEADDEPGALLRFTEALEFAERGRAVLKAQTRQRAEETQLWDGILAVNRLRVEFLLRQYPLAEYWPGATDGRFSPDGTQIATVDHDRTVRLWDVKTGAAINSFPPPTGHIAPVTGVFFNREGTHLATLSQDSTVHIWHVSRKTPVSVVRVESPIRHAAFSVPMSFNTTEEVPNLVQSHTFVTVSENGKISRWTAEGVEVFRSEPVKGQVLGLSSNGRHLLTANAKQIEIYDLESMESDTPIAAYPQPAGSRITMAAFSEQGNQFAVAFETDGESKDSPPARIADSSTGENPPDLLLQEAQDAPEVGTPTFLVLSAKIGMGESRPHHLEHPAAVRHLRLSPNGNRLFCGMEDQTARIWNLDAQASTVDFSSWSHSLAIDEAAFSSDGSLLAVAGRQGDAAAPGILRVWDAQTRNVLVKAVKHHAPIHCLRFHPQDNSLFAAGGTGNIGEARLWDFQRLQDGMRFLPDSRDVVALAFDPQSLFLIDYHGEKSKAWKLPSGTLVAVPDEIPILHGRLKFAWDENSVSHPHEGIPERPGFQVTPEILSTGGRWSEDSREEANLRQQRETEIRKQLEQEIQSLPPLPKIEERFELVFLDQQRFVTQLTAASEERSEPRNAIRVWDLATGRPLTRLLPHSGAVVSVVFNNAGLMATACSDGSLQVWSLESSLPVTPPLRFGTSQIPHALSQNGQYLVSSSPLSGNPQDGARLILWDLASGNPRPAGQLLSLAQVLSGKRSDSTGEFQPLPPAEIQRIWELSRSPQVPETSPGK